MEISDKTYDNHILLTISGILSIDNLKAFDKVLNDFSGENKHIFIDLTDVSFIDSATLGLIVLYLSRMEKNNLHLVLLNAKEHIKEMFKISGVFKQLKFYDSYREGVKSIFKD